jgi:hypothetical protein
MLPEGFSWQGIHSNDRGVPTVLALGSTGVARMMDRIDGSWFVRLDYHLYEAPLRTRPCTSFDAGRAGCELWVARHEERLRREVAARDASRPLVAGMRALNASDSRS